MVFSSLPVYLDSPNWHQQRPNQQEGALNETLQFRRLPSPAYVGAGRGGSSGGTGGPIRHGSMADRAQFAKLPQPEADLKCPRCESTNTKFCYFNNYSLSQPRHFCKTCRRYWTRGGALRNVPVGGGCRRSKKSKSHHINSSSSKSPVSNEMPMGSNSISCTSGIPSEIIGHHHLPPQTTQSFLPFLNNLMQFGAGNIGLNLIGTPAHIGGAASTGASSNGLQTDMGSILSGQQFPMFELPPTSLFPCQSDQGIDHQGPSSMVGESQTNQHHQSGVTSSSRVSQLAPVKFEENHQGLNLSKLFLGISDQNNNQYWSGNTWTDLSGLNSSSTTHIL